MVGLDQELTETLRTLQGIAQHDEVEEDLHDPFGGADELTCAICLDQIPPVDLAVVKGCEHLYCGRCQHVGVK